LESCIFCKIINHEAPAYIIDENVDVIVFLSLENHPLVVTKAHHANIYSLDDALGAAVMQEAIKIAKAVKQGLGCDGVYLTQANEAAGGQDVFHFHLHVYPRWDTDRALAGPVTKQVHLKPKTVIVEKIRNALTSG
jgi:histidine triad (HIT) family protein